MVAVIAATASARASRQAAAAAAPLVHPITGVTGASVEVTPPTKRGVTVQWAGTHWLSGTTFLAVEVVHEMVQDLTGGVLTPMKRGQYSYECGARGPGGCQVYWSAGRAEVLVVFPGEACELLGAGGTMAAAVVLQLRVTRLDVAWDIEGLPVSRVAKAFKRGDVVGRVHRDSHETRENKQGSTFYIGSRTSPRFLRFYDRRGPVRMEMEVKDVRAQRLVELLQAHSEEDWSSVCIGHVRDFCDFRRREPGDRPEDAPLLRWWGSVVQGAERQRIIIPGKRPTLERTERWLKASVAPMLSLWLEATSSGATGRSRPAVDLVGELVLDGRARWTPRHHALLRNLQAVATA